MVEPAVIIVAGLLTHFPSFQCAMQIANWCSHEKYPEEVKSFIGTPTWASLHRVPRARELDVKRQLLIKTSGSGEYDSMENKILPSHRICKTCHANVSNATPIILVTLEDDLVGRLIRLERHDGERAVAGENEGLFFLFSLCT